MIAKLLNDFNFPAFSPESDDCNGQIYPANDEWTLLYYIIIFDYLSLLNFELVINRIVAIVFIIFFRINFYD